MDPTEELLAFNGKDRVDYHFLVGFIKRKKVLNESEFCKLYDILFFGILLGI